MSALDVSGSVDLSWDQAPSGGGYFTQLQLRTQGDEYYYARVRTSAASTTLSLVRRSGGITTFLSSVTVPLSYSPGDVWRLVFEVELARSDQFYDAIRTYWPGLPHGCIAPAYAGVRPKLSGPGEPAADFRIDGPELHGWEGMVHLFGIESPGLTSSLAIADEVCDRLDLR